MKKLLQTEQQKKQQALSVSIKEGSAANFSAGLAETYITPFALELKASPLNIGFLSSISGLIAPLAQIIGDKLMDKNSRKKIVRNFVLMQAVMLIPIASLSFFYWKSIGLSHLPWILILLYALFAAMGGIAYPAWFSWMGDLVPKNQRGKYFGRKGRINGAVGLAAILIGGMMIDALKTKGIVLLGFSILFIIASIARLISYYLLNKQYSPKFPVKKTNYFSIFSFLKRMDNYGKFSVSNALFNFTLMIASPFFSVYMLKELNFTYKIYTIIIISSVLFTIISSSFIGRLADKYGNKKIFALSCILFSINPLLWMFIKAPVLLVVLQIIAGIANAGMLLSVNNFTYDAVSPKNRALCITYTNILAGMGVFLGSLLGGFLIDYLHPQSMNPFIFVFLVSAIGRSIVSVILVPKIKEQRKVNSLRPPNFHLIHLFRSINAEIHWFKHTIK